MKIEKLLAEKAFPQIESKEHYERALAKLQLRMLRIQQGVYHDKRRVIIALEGVQAIGPLDDSLGRSLQGVRSEPQIGEGPVEVGVQVVGTIGPPPADGDRIGVHAHLGAQGRERLGDAAGLQGIGERGD